LFIVAQLQVPRADDFGSPSEIAEKIDDRGLSSKGDGCNRQFCGSRFLRRYALFAQGELDFM